MNPRFQIPSRAVLADGTYDVIRGMLLNHTITPGERIVIDSLARDLDVSQTPIRESLARLEADGLVVKQALRGYAATPLLTSTEVDDLFQFRLLLEPWSAERAASQLDADGEAALESELGSVINAGVLDDSRNLDEAYELMSAHDSRFHGLIATLSGSPMVSDAFDRTHCHLHLLRLYRAGQARIAEAREDSGAVSDLFGMYYQPSNGFLAFAEHRAIAAAIADGDSERARALMAAHIQSSRDRFSTILSTLEHLPSGGADREERSR